MDAAKQIESKVRDAASLSEATLRAMTVRQLREVANGWLKGFKSLPKAELIEAILDGTSEIRERVEVETLQAKAAAEVAIVKAEEERLKLQATEIEEPSIRVRRELLSVGAPIDRANDLYDMLRKIATESAAEEQLSAGVEAVFASHIRIEGSCYTTSSQASNGTDVCRILKERLALENDFFASRIGIAIGRFISLYKHWLSAAIAEKNRANKANISATHRTTATVKASEMLREARLILSSPDGYRWQQVSRAIALTTGRRLAEVHYSATFEPVDETTVSFAGQLKTKGRETSDSYEIPTLAPATQVIAALDYLASIGKRSTSADSADKLFSKPLSRSLEGTEIEVGGQSRKMKYSDLRALYAEICAVLFWKSAGESGRSKADYFRSILGHGEGDVTTAQSYEKFAVDDESIRSM